MMKVLAGGSIPRVGFGTFRKLPMIPYLTIAPSTLATVASLFYALVYMEYNGFVHFYVYLRSVSMEDIRETVKCSVLGL